jgi:uncharacterized membrane protein (UPF0182 family)
MLQVRMALSDIPLRLIIGTAILLIVVLAGIAGYLEKWLWMRQLHYTGIFWTILSVQWAMFCGIRARISVLCNWDKFGRAMEAPKQLLADPAM